MAAAPWVTVFSNSFNDTTQKKSNGLKDLLPFQSYFCDVTWYGMARRTFPSKYRHMTSHLYGIPAVKKNKRKVQQDNDFIVFHLNFRRLNMEQHFESILHRLHSFHIHNIMLQPKKRFDVCLINFLHEMQLNDYYYQEMNVVIYFQGHFALELFVIDMKFKRKRMISHKKYIFRCYLLLV